MFIPLLGALGFGTLIALAATAFMQDVAQTQKFLDTLREYLGPKDPL